MNNLEIANKLGVDNRYLSARCSRPDSALLWALREFLKRNKLVHDNHDFELYVIKFMATLLSPEKLGGIKQVMRLMVDGLIVISPNIVLHYEIVKLLKLSPQYKKGLLDWLELDRE